MKQERQPIGYGAAQTAALESKKRFWKFVLWAVILLAIVTLGYFAYKAYKNYQQNQIIDKEKDRLTNEKGAPGAGTGGGSGAGTGAWPVQDKSQGDTVVSVQKLVNLKPPGGKKITEDGIFGSKTKAAWLTLPGAKYPITQDNYTQVLHILTDPGTTTTGTTGRPVGPKYSGFELGNQLYAKNTPGAIINTYTSPAPSDASLISGLIKPGSYIGDYLATEKGMIKIATDHGAVYAMPGDVYSQAPSSFAANLHGLFSPGTYKQIGGRSCVKQWNQPTGQWVWNCGGGVILDMHEQVI